MGNSGKSYNMVDILKFVCAVGVVIIHTDPFIEVYAIDKFVTVFTRLCVPFFFLTTGFFCFRSDECGKIDNRRVLKTLKRLVILYVLATIIYIPFCFRHTDMLNHARTFLVGGVGGGLWYLLALIFAVALIGILATFMRMKWIFVVSVAFFTAGTLLATYAPLFERFALFNKIHAINELFYNSRNGLFFGFVFVALGAVIKQYGVPKFSLPVSLTATAACVFVLAVECVLSVVIKAPNRSLFFIDRKSVV